MAEGRYSTFVVYAARPVPPTHPVPSVQYPVASTQ